MTIKATPRIPALHRFLRATDGNVAVDWLVLTSFVLGIAAVISGTVMVSIDGVSTDARSDIDAVQTGENFGS